MNKEQIIMMCKTLSQRMGVTMPTIRFQKMKNKWASCSIERKILTLNKDVINLPEESVRYILIHELLHLKIPTHNRLFRAFLGVYFPEWQEVHQQLVFYMERVK